VFLFSFEVGAKQAHQGCQPTGKKQPEQEGSLQISQSVFAISFWNTDLLILRLE